MSSRFLKRLLVLLGLLVLLTALWFSTEPSKSNPSFSSPNGGKRPGEEAVPSSAATTTSLPGQTGSSIGETTLRDYAKPSASPEHDLDLMAQLMNNFLLLVKPAASRPLSANEDWADALRGRNPARERFLPDQHAALNARGQLVDRWGTPLFFHALGNGQFEIRSAGPDRKLWTADDIHRNADGSFHKGAELHSASLANMAMER